MSRSASRVYFDVQWFISLFRFRHFQATENVPSFEQSTNAERVGEVQRLFRSSNNCL